MMASNRITRWYPITLKRSLHTGTQTFGILKHSHVLYNDVSVSNGPHIQWWSQKMIMELKNLSPSDISAMLIQCITHVCRDAHVKKNLWHCQSSKSIAHAITYST